ncbi:MAG: MFS transporter [Candidatus Latescibacterota bacterium]|nr:MFS transporter [Candidatus Latescibacterota bacterium]
MERASSYRTRLGCNRQGGLTGHRMISSRFVSQLPKAERLKIRRLPWVILSGGLSSIYSTFALGTVSILFYDAMGLSKSQIGLLNALIFLPGPLAIFIAPLASKWGFKRTFMVFYSARKILIMLLAASPWILEQYALAGVAIYTTSLMSLYGVLRVTAETAIYPWQHEYVPPRVRGKFTAITNMVSTLVGIGAVSAASHYLENGTTGLAAYQFLLIVGSIFGLLSVFAKWPVPGGHPDPKSNSYNDYFVELRRPLNDRPFCRFILGLSFVSIATHSWATFIPLYMKEEVGLQAGQIVHLQTWNMVGTLLSSYFWGYFSDKIGSTRVLFIGLAGMTSLPILWFFLPNIPTFKIIISGLSCAAWGITTIGFSIGQERRLNVELVTPEHKTEYMTIFYTTSQIAAVISPILAGWGLEWCQDTNSDYWLVTWGTYTPFFFISSLILLTSLRLFRPQSTSVTQ